MTEEQMLEKLGFTYEEIPDQHSWDGLKPRYESSSIGGIKIVIDNGKPRYERWTAYGAGFECDDGMYITDALEGLIQGLIGEGLLSEDLPILSFFDELDPLK